ncbi:hypothetical protein RFI_09698 [Reticulomyxa filosa]|uniref:Nuclear transcription factor Y subunit n=1 Tax=Reticulomyxa filosa TaxID=46433 RepID=X6NN79_RETFI|nr:hypothetical protein RFI_09698 [Reticulomyxa filosa]|eukprot:ETO27431.1 hypothetical protein RFI_09698 [Reticulomyxa filosa]
MSSKVEPGILFLLSQSSLTPFVVAEQSKIYLSTVPSQPTQFGTQFWLYSCENSSERSDGRKTQDCDINESANENQRAPPSTEISNCKKEILESWCADKPTPSLCVLSNNNEKPNEKMREIQTENKEASIFVNPKQFYRILRRRELRTQLRNRMIREHRIQVLYSVNGRTFRYQSRHKLAQRRPRAPNGKFLSKQHQSKPSHSEDNNLVPLCEMESERHDGQDNTK